MSGEEKGGTEGEVIKSHLFAFSKFLRFCRSFIPVSYLVCTGEYRPVAQDPTGESLEPFFAKDSF